jgi:hypothetical protein
MLRPDGCEGFQGSFRVLDSLDLGREYLPDHTRLVYTVGYPTWDDAKGVWHTIHPSHLTSVVAEQGERKVVLLGETFV